jgi:hypothetical protein
LWAHGLSCVIRCNETGWYSRNNFREHSLSRSFIQFLLQRGNASEGGYVGLTLGGLNI